MGARERPGRIEEEEDKGQRFGVKWQVLPDF